MISLCAAIVRAAIKIYTYPYAEPEQYESGPAPLISARSASFALPIPGKY